MKNSETNLLTNHEYTRSRAWRWTKRVLAGLAGLLIILSVIGAIFQFIATKVSERRYPPPGKLVDIGGYRLHLYCLGEGAPTVIMDSGAGGNSLSWYLVQPEIAKFTRVCTYDRAGLGWSDPSPLPRTSRQFVKELHALLTNAGIKGRYVLVGHSLGGMNMRLYAGSYPGDVVGMVLVDSAHEDQWSLFPKRKSTFPQIRLLNPQLRQKLLSILGVNSLFRLWSRPDPKASPHFQDMYEAVQTRTRNLITLTDEFSSVKEDVEQLRAAPKILGNMPLVVLAHKEGGPILREGPIPLRDMSDEQKNQFMEIERILHELQVELSHRSRNGKLIIATESGHGIQHDQPELVIEAVRTVIRETTNEALHRTR